MICTFNTFKPPSPQDTDTFNGAMANIKFYVLCIQSWMTTICLKLNDPKTEFLLVGSRYGALVP